MYLLGITNSCFSRTFRRLVSAVRVFSSGLLFVISISDFALYCLWTDFIHALSVGPLLLSTWIIRSVPVFSLLMAMHTVKVVSLGLDGLDLEQLANTVPSGGWSDSHGGFIAWKISFSLKKRGWMS